MNKNIARRLAKLRTQVRRLKLDAIVITNQTNVRYLSGFTGDSSAILVTQSETVSSRTSDTLNRQARSAPATGS